MRYLLDFSFCRRQTLPPRCGPPALTKGGHKKEQITHPPPQMPASPTIHGWPMAIPTKRAKHTATFAQRIYHSSAGRISLAKQISPAAGEYHRTARCPKRTNARRGAPPHEMQAFRGDPFDLIDFRQMNCSEIGAAGAAIPEFPSPLTFCPKCTNARRGELRALMWGWGSIQNKGRF